MCTSILNKHARMQVNDSKTFQLCLVSIKLKIEDNIWSNKDIFLAVLRAKISYNRQHNEPYNEQYNETMSIKPFLYQFSQPIYTIN